MHAGSSATTAQTLVREATCESQISAAAASADHDARSIDERKFAQVFDDREGVLDGIGGLGINITTAVGRCNEDVAGCQKARTGGEITRSGFEAGKRHGRDASVKPYDDREGPAPGGFRITASPRWPSPATGVIVSSGHAFSATMGRVTAG